MMMSLTSSPLSRQLTGCDGCVQRSLATTKTATKAVRASSWDWECGVCSDATDDDCNDAACDNALTAQYRAVTCTDWDTLPTKALLHCV